MLNLNTLNIEAQSLPPKLFGTDSGSHLIFGHGLVTELGKLIKVLLQRGTLGGPKLHTNTLKLR